MLVKNVEIETICCFLEWSGDEFVGKGAENVMDI